MRRATYFTLLLSWLLAFDGFDLPIRFPVLFVVCLLFALYAKGFFLFTIFAVNLKQK